MFSRGLSASVGAVTNVLAGAAETRSVQCADANAVAPPPKQRLLGTASRARSSQKPF